MAELYRKAALERISSPEQLDKTLTITSPLSWLILIGITLIVAAAIVWSIIGTIPLTVGAVGIIAAPYSTNAVYSQGAGTVNSININSGSELKVGDTILTYKTQGGNIEKIVSDQKGIVTSILVSTGDVIGQFAEVIRISPKTEASQIAACYVPLAQAKTLKSGMKANIYLDSADSQSYGHIEATVINIDSYAGSAEGMASVMGNDSTTINGILQSGAMVAVTCQLKPDKSTPSGYYWTNSKGASLTISNGTPVTAKIVTAEIAPITKLFAKLDEVWGD